MLQEVNCEKKNRSKSRSRSKSKKRSTQLSQDLISINQNDNKQEDCCRLESREQIYNNSSPIKLNPELNKSEAPNKESKEEFKILDHTQFVKLAPNNQFQIQCEYIGQSEKHIPQIPPPQKDIGNNLEESQEKQPSEMITINDSSQENYKVAEAIQNKATLHLNIPQVDNQKIDPSKNCLYNKRIPKILRSKIKRSFQDQKQLQLQKKSFECIDLTNDDHILSFFGINHPMLQSSIEYSKKELFELVEPFEYLCGNFMISLGVNAHYTAIVTLPSLYQKKSVYYLFMMFLIDQEKIYCLVPEDDQTTLLVSSNIQSLYYYCNSNSQLKKNNKTNFLESTLKYKFPYIYPALIRKFIVSNKKNDQQILYQINYDQHATRLAIEDYYQAIPGHLIIGTSHPILKILFFKSQYNQIPQFYYKFLSNSLYEGQFSLKAQLQSNGNILIIERRFLSPFCQGIYQIKIEINRLTNFIVMKQVGKDSEFQSKTIEQFWNEIQSKYLKLYPSKFLFNYFVDLIIQDRKVQEKYKEWNQLYDSMVKSQYLKPNKFNDKPVFVKDKQFYCFSIEDMKNGKKINIL